MRDRKSAVPLLRGKQVQHSVRQCEQVSNVLYLGTTSELGYVVVSPISLRAGNCNPSQALAKHNARMLYK